MIRDARLSAPRALPDAILRGGERPRSPLPAHRRHWQRAIGADERAADDVLLRAAKPYERRMPAPTPAACQSAQAAPRLRDRHPRKDVQCPP